MVELEFLNEFRDYKLHIKYKNKCSCGSTLNLHMTGGSVNQQCNNNFCRKQYDIIRKIKEEDWKAGVLLYKETKERCERQL